MWPAVVDRQTWEATRALLLDEARTTHLVAGSPHDGARRYLLTGFLRCGRCGARLHPRRNATGQRLGCKATKDGGCGGILLRYDPAEELVVDLLLDRLERKADLQPPAPAHRTSELLERIAGDEARLDELGQAFADDPEPTRSSSAPQAPASADGSRTPAPSSPGRLCSSASPSRCPCAPPGSPATTTSRSAAPSWRCSSSGSTLEALRT